MIPYILTWKFLIAYCYLFSYYSLNNYPLSYLSYCVSISTPLVTEISIHAASSSINIYPSDNASSMFISYYQLYENNLKSIIFSTIKFTPDRKLILQIFYNNRKLKNLCIQNNVNKPEHESSLIYKYTIHAKRCPVLRIMLFI